MMGTSLPHYSMSHTPGPWTFYRLGEGFRVLDATTPVAFVHQWEPKTPAEANARLIAYS